MELLDIVFLSCCGNESSLTVESRRCVSLLEDLVRSQLRHASLILKKVKYRASILEAKVSMNKI